MLASMLKFDTLKRKTIALGLAAALLPTIVLLVVVFVQKARLSSELSKSLDTQVKDSLGQIARDMQGLCQSQQESLEQTVDANLNVARDVLARRGGGSLLSGTAGWDAVNQFTKSPTKVTLPQFAVGGNWLGQTRDARARVPVVDEVARMVGGTCTVFQRMNSGGDMLRVATNVLQKNGSRAIGTYIPATKDDGAPNPIVSSVLGGQRYVGRAFVVDSWYITAYEPIKDPSGRVIGMLYVGVKQEKVASLRKALMSTKVGKSGYVFVLGGTGDERGKYIVSLEGKRDGENIWDAKDSDGHYFIRTMVEKAMANGGEATFVDYPWKNEGESKARLKRAAVIYFEPWDWVIGASAYEDEFAQASAAADKALGRLVAWSLVAGLIIMSLSVLAAARLGTSVAAPVHRAASMLKDIAEGEGDLTKRLEVIGKDEVAELSSWFNVFVERIHDLVTHVRGSAEGVATASQELSGMAEQVNQATQQITETISQIAIGSQEQSKSVQVSAHAIDEFGRATREVAEGAQSQATTVEQTVGLVQRISSAINHVSSLTQQAAESGNQVTEVAAVGGKQVSQAVDGMSRIKAATDEVARMVEKLGQSSQQIGAIVETIDDIAEQTNLLALNAAIEAARAGEHGTGFAVVADEVRKLAERSSNATREIAELIGSTQQMTDGAVDAMNRGSREVEDGAALANQAGDALKAIQEAVAGIVQQVQQVSVAIQEIGSSNADLVSAVETVSAITEQTTASAEEMSASSGEVSDQIGQVAAVSEENAAAAEEVSATAEEQTASIEQVTVSAEKLAEMAGELRQLVLQFKVEDRGAEGALQDISQRVTQGQRIEGARKPSARRAA